MFNADILKCKCVKEAAETINICNNALTMSGQ